MKPNHMSKYFAAALLVGGLALAAAAPAGAHRGPNPTADAPTQAGRILPQVALPAEPANVPSVKARQVAFNAECYIERMSVFFGLPGDRSFYNYSNAAVFGAVTGAVVGIYCWHN